MRYRLPSLNALRALDAVGRRGSLSAAARELGVSVGAISRHIALLEGHFGRTLLRRLPSGVQPTQACAEYLDVLERAFQDIDSASHWLATQRQSDNVLRLRLYSTFTTEWLTARLADFYAQHPDIRLDLTLSIKDAEWRDDDFDMALSARPPSEAQFRSERLFNTYFGIVCSPQLIEDAPWESAERLNEETLLMSPREAELWNAILDKLKVPEPDDQNRIMFESLSMTYQAARRGGGVALGNLFIIADDLRDGRLVLPLREIFATQLPHHIVTRRGRPDGPNLTAFRTWLINAARQAELELNEILSTCSILDMKVVLPPAGAQAPPIVTDVSDR